VGSSVAHQLRQQGWLVRALVRPGSDRRNIAELDLDLVEGDLRSESSRQQAVAGMDAVFHVAADYRLWLRNPAEMYESNVDATTALVSAATRAGVKRIVYTSSVATLAPPTGDVPSDETNGGSLDGMISHYKRSKFLAEQEVLRLIEVEGAPVVIVKPTTPFGPRDVKPTPTGRIVVQAMTGRMPAYVDAGLNVVHVDDVAAGHLLAHAKGRMGQSYILGGENMTLKDILYTICELSGVRPARPAAQCRGPAHCLRCRTVCAPDGQCRAFRYCRWRQAGPPPHVLPQRQGHG
jgi:dihydroflavonol-4-reductase